VLQADRLRRDLWVFHQLTLTATQALAQPGAGPSAAEPLRRFAAEFRDVSYQLLRHSDREAFDRFLELLEAFCERAGGADEARQLRLQKLRDDCRRFSQILEVALQTVDRRAELIGSPPDQASWSQALARHLGRE
jgi:hypothetical protein